MPWKLIWHAPSEKPCLDVLFPDPSAKRRGSCPCSVFPLPTHTFHLFEYFPTGLSEWLECFLVRLTYMWRVKGYWATEIHSSPPQQLIHPLNIVLHVCVWYRPRLCSTERKTVLVSGMCCPVVEVYRTERAYTHISSIEAQLSATRPLGSGRHRSPNPMVPLVSKEGLPWTGVWRMNGYLQVYGRTTLGGSGHSDLKGTEPWTHALRE